MVVADSRYEAEDACELIEVDYEPLPPVATYEAALDPQLPSPVRGPGGQRRLHVVPGDRRRRRGVRRGRPGHRSDAAPAPHRQRPDGDPRGRGRLRPGVTGAHLLRRHPGTPRSAAPARRRRSDIPMERIRVLSGDVGGAFGLKGGVFREDVCLAAASKHLGRPIKWIEDRNEHLLASGHAREEMIEARGGRQGGRHPARHQGQARSWTRAPTPAVPFCTSACSRRLIQMLLPGPYRFKGYAFDITVVATNKCVYVAYRGPVGDGDLGPGAAARHRGPRARPGPGRGPAQAT